MMGVRFNPEITLGHVMQALIAAGGVASVIFVFAGRLNETSHDFVSFKQDVLSKIEDMKHVTHDQIQGITANIAFLPDIQATLKQMDRRLEADEHRLDGQDNRAAAQSDRMLHIESVANDAQNRLNDLSPPGMLRYRRPP